MCRGPLKIAAHTATSFYKGLVEDARTQCRHWLCSKGKVDCEQAVELLQHVHFRDLFFIRSVAAP
jgi:hypothetical protein